MKSNIIKSTALLLCVLLIAACSGKKADNKAYLAVIPDDAMIVSKVEIGNLLDKSDILGNTFVKVEFEKAIADVPAQQRVLLKEIFANPKASGIDISAPLYVAVLGMEPAKIVMTARMGDMTAFENMMSTLLEDEFETTEKDGMYHIVSEDMYYSVGETAVAFAYDADKMVLVFEEGYADISSYLKLPSNRQALNNEKFEPLFGGDDDISWMINYGPLVQYMIKERVIDREMIPFFAMMKESIVLCSFDFEDGYAEIKSTQNLSEEHRLLIQDFLKKSTHRHYAYIPDNSFAVISYNFNLMQLYGILETTGLLKELEKNGVNNGVAKDLLAALSGDYTFAAWADGETLENMQFMVAVDCSDRSLFDLLIAYAQFELGATTVDDDVYLFDGLDYCIMYKENAIMLMPEDLYDKINVRGDIKPLRRNLESNRLFSSVANDIVLDFKPVRELIAEYVRENMSYRSQRDTQTMVMLEMLNVVENLTVDSNIDKSCIRVNTANKNINSLKYILDKLISSAVRNGKYSY